MTKWSVCSQLFPNNHSKTRVDDRRMLGSIIFVNRNGLRWRDAPPKYGPHKTLYKHWKHRSYDTDCFRDTLKEKGIRACLILSLTLKSL
ncbi:hypothetical protein GKA01_21330 [Gluconobacter kanchanaburiensis NBRC 103587]|uniref:Insertion element IS402-like domain-containing protein n=1 Tax=Gluconobacter kanchanaburiensis NBRC 103587 TaxID=1307948 RepID=A0A511B920_9PROT|nr:transposase [Gluconobacter kanchanaburiensis NBRC 103587]GEK96936.1 hypothetical protein GKA01_21330 [Gluconobacter kanchanaburiensis NBRC 103587]